YIQYQLTSISVLRLVKCNFGLNCILKQVLRCYDLRSKSLKKPPFRPHFRPFCPHPAYGSSLRAEVCTHFLAPPTRAGATHFAAPMSACTRSTFTRTEQAFGS